MRKWAVLMLFFCATLVATSVSYGVNSNFSIQINGGPQCADTLDNDGDGFIDFPADPECDSATDNSESRRSSGDGGIFTQQDERVLFNGFGFRNQDVYLLIDGRQVDSVQARRTGAFTLDLDDIQPGSYLFSLYTTDEQGRRSNLYHMYRTIEVHQQIEFFNIVLSPSITSVATRAGNEVSIITEGFATPDADVRVSIRNIGSQTIMADANGYYRSEWIIETERNEFDVMAVATIGSLISNESYTAHVIVGETEAECTLRGDLNGDCRVNLIDFSIGAYWYSRTLSEALIAIEERMLNGDGVIDLRDFSIMAFFWTG